MPGPPAVDRAGGMFTGGLLPDMRKSRRAEAAASKTPKAARRPIVRWVVVVGALLVAAGLWGWYGSKRPPEPPDILLISIDTLRADRLGCYAYKTGRTPNIDRLAAGGVVFDAVSSPVPITLPSHASMLTGLIPPRHGVRLNEGYSLPDEAVTLAEVLHAQGYQTGAFVAGLPMVKAGGLDQGFEVYDDRLSPRTLGGKTPVLRHERYAEDVFTAARDWLVSTDSARPVFAFIHVYDPHAPYEKSLPGAPGPSYDGEVAYVDRALGAFQHSLAREKRWSEMVTVLTSDHGEGLGEHREKTHGVFVYESTLRVPLIIHWPGVITPHRVGVPVGVIDVAPTILELAGLPGLSDVDGRSLRVHPDATIKERERPASDQREFYFESLLGSLKFGWGTLRGVRSGHLKYIAAPRPELYDLQLDPNEQNNLYGSRPSKTARWDQYLRTIGEGAEAVVEVDQQTIAALASLGYVSAPPATPVDPTERADPKDRIEVYERYQSAHIKSAAGRYEEALAIMEPLEPEFFNSPVFYSRWGEFAARAQRWQLAERCYEKCLALDGQHQTARLNLGVTYLKRNSPAKALEQFEALLQINPDHAEAHLYAGVVKQQHLRTPAEAIPHWKRFLELAPDHSQADTIRETLERLGDG